MAQVVMTSSLPPATTSIKQAEAHLVFLTATGVGSQMIDFVDYPLRPGHLVHVQPGQVHRRDPCGTDCTTTLRIAVELCPDELFAGFVPRPNVDLGPNQPVANAMFVQLSKQLNQSAPLRLVAASAKQLLSQLAVTGDHNSVGYSQQADLVRLFRRAVDTDCALERRVASYAQAIGSSPRTLNRATVAVTGLSPKDIIDARVALEAQRKLAVSPASIATVATTLGFGEPSNFSKFFVRLTGTTPTTFREQL